MRMALGCRFPTTDLVADLLLKRHKAVFPGAIRLPHTLMHLVVMDGAAQVGRLGRIALRLFALVAAVVLAVEQVVGADGHLLVVFLLGLLAG